MCWENRHQDYPHELRVDVWDALDVSANLVTTKKKITGLNKYVESQENVSADQKVSYWLFLMRVMEGMGFRESRIRA